MKVRHIVYGVFLGNVAFALFWGALKVGIFLLVS